VFVQTSLAEAAHWLPRLADALVALDALQVIGVPPRQKPRTLASEVENYLTGLYGRDKVRRQPNLRLTRGLRVSPALVAQPANREEILIQPGAVTSVTQSFDHAYATFSLASLGGVAQTRCLTILGGEVPSWNLLRLRALSEVTFVGFWSHREQVRAFLDGEIPDDPLMLPDGVDVPLLAD